MMNRATWSGLLGINLLAAMVLGCGGCGERGKDGDNKDKGTTARLSGTGSSFINPIMSKWAHEYEKAKGDKVNYQPTGSGAGIKAMTEGSTDFGCADVPMNEEQLKKAKDKNGDVIHVPLVMGAVAVIYHLDEAKDRPVKISGPVLAEIYLHKIKKWNDHAIKKLNPDVDLPDKEIVVVHRSDSSGTTFIFTDFLSKVSPEWAKGPGKNASISWPTGLGEQGSDKVAGQVKRSAGSIGYVELTFALQNKIPYAAVENKEGKFVAPSLASVTAAAKESLSEIPDDLRYSITDPAGADSYPISGTTWAVVYTNNPGGNGKAVREFLHWCTHEGQQEAEALHYSRLPEGLVHRVEKKLEMIK